MPRSAATHGRRIGLTDAETADYLDGFNYRLGEREREAIAKFAALVEEVEEQHEGRRQKEEGRQGRSDGREEQIED